MTPWGSDTGPEISPWTLRRQAKVDRKVFMKEVCVCILTRSVVSDSVTPWTVACQAPLSVGFKNTGVGCHFLLQEIFPIQGSNSPLLLLLHWQAGSLPGKPGKQR